jgi:hypothetical protein
MWFFFIGLESIVRKPMPNATPKSNTNTRSMLPFFEHPCKKKNNTKGRKRNGYGNGRTNQWSSLGQPVVVMMEKNQRRWLFPWQRWRKFRTQQIHQGYARRICGGLLLYQSLFAMSFGLGGNLASVGKTCRQCQLFGFVSNGGSTGFTRSLWKVLVPHVGVVGSFGITTLLSKAFQKDFSQVLKDRIAGIRAVLTQHPQDTPTTTPLNTNINDNNNTKKKKPIYFFTSLEEYLAIFAENVSISSRTIGTSQRGTTTYYLWS